MVSAQALSIKPDAGLALEQRRTLQEYLRDTPLLASFPRSVTDWSAPLAALGRELRIGRSQLVYDEAMEDRIEQRMGAGIFNFFNLAEAELLIQNAYVIPAQRGIDYLTERTDAGVSVRLLTNSLASHDVPAVNSHYKGWRDDYINAGAELFELRADAEIQSLVDVPPVSGEFVGLHTKAFVVDREYAFVGSMNFDPRSVNINTESGAFVRSPGLAEDLARVMERDMSPDNAWQVLLDEKGKPYWVNSDETVTRQPARGGSQRVMDAIFRIFPKEQF